MTDTTDMTFKRFMELPHGAILAQKIKRLCDGDQDVLLRFCYGAYCQGRIDALQEAWNFNIEQQRSTDNSMDCLLAEFEGELKEGSDD